MKQIANSGFTLIEIIVVLAILSLALSIVPPLFSNGLDSARMKQAARQISASLRTVRVNAISSQSEKILMLDVEEASLTQPEGQKKLDIPDDARISLVTAKSEQQSETKGGIRFYPDGSSTGGRITLEHKSLIFNVDINWLTGQVAISP